MLFLLVLYNVMDSGRMWMYFPYLSAVNFPLQSAPSRSHWLIGRNPKVFALKNIGLIVGKIQINSNAVKFTLVFCRKFNRKPSLGRYNGFHQRTWTSLCETRRISWSFRLVFSSENCWGPQQSDDHEHTVQSKSHVLASNPTGPAPVLTSVNELWKQVYRNIIWKCLVELPHSLPYLCSIFEFNKNNFVLIFIR